jgi:hypothetical protein
MNQTNSTVNVPITAKILFLCTDIGEVFHYYIEDDTFLGPEARQEGFALQSDWVIHNAAFQHFGHNGRVAEITDLTLLETATICQGSAYHLVDGAIESAALLAKGGIDEDWGRGHGHGPAGS